MSENPLGDLGKLSEPATRLIEKVSDAVGGIAKPWQIKRVAKAEAEAEIIIAQGHAAATEIQERAIRRFMREEEIKQINMESITTKAIPLLDENSKPEELDNDWLFHFFDKARMYSDEQVQIIWAKLLAKETNNGGSFSRKTINILSDLDKQDIELFISVCRFSFDIVIPTLLIYEYDDPIYENNGLEWDTISLLESLGLLELYYITGYERLLNDNKVDVYYGESELSLSFDKSLKQEKEGYRLGVGKVNFSRAGIELKSIIDTEPVSGFIEYVIEKINNEVGVELINVR